MEEGTAGPRKLPARNKGTQRGHARIVSEAALFGVEESLHEAVVCVLLLIWEPMVRVFIALGNVECGLQELELHMLVLVDAFVMIDGYTTKTTAASRYGGITTKQ